MPTSQQGAANAQNPVTDASPRRGESWRVSERTPHPSSVRGFSFLAGGASSSRWCGRWESFRGMSQVPFSPAFGRKAGFFPFCVAAVLDQDFAFNLSTKRRLCHTVGGRFIDGVPRCCAVSSARSRAAATTNLARSNQSLVLRALFAGAKSCAPVNVSMICPPVVGRSVAEHDQILSLIHGHLMARLTRQRPRQGQRGAINIGGGRCRMRLRRFGKTP